METGKLFIGPRLRALRLERGLTQTDFARLLGVSGSLVNLLERNQRSASLAVLMRLSDVFGLEMQELTSANTQVSLQQLRKTLSDPAVGVDDISIDELRSAMDLAPKVVEGLMTLFDSYQLVQERLAGTLETTEDRSKSLRASEQRVHEFFQRKGNYFEELEQIAEGFRERHELSNDHALSVLSNIIKQDHQTSVKVVEHEVIAPSVRRYDAGDQTLYLSDSLDHGNKVFQLAHWIGLMVYADEVDAVVRQADFSDQHDAARARVALCDYFAAALLMPYEPFIEAAKKWSYDFERLAASFSVSYEQVCQRATTLQRPSNRGIPFFFLRVDKGGNVSKRFNASSIQLARYGGTCPRLDVHYCFRVPGRILTQRVEMPDGAEFITINRTVSRPSSRFNQEDRRQAVSVGCAIQHAPELVYGADNTFGLPGHATEIGVNCRLCPRAMCDQRAHESIVRQMPLTESRRGQNRFEN